MLLLLLCLLLLLLLLQLLLLLRRALLQISAGNVVAIDLLFATTRTDRERAGGRLRGTRSPHLRRYATFRARIAFGCQASAPTRTGVS